MQSTIFESIIPYFQNHAMLFKKCTYTCNSTSYIGEHYNPILRKLVLYVAIDITRTKVVSIAKYPL